MSVTDIPGTEIPDTRTQTNALQASIPRSSSCFQREHLEVSFLRGVEGTCGGDQHWNTFVYSSASVIARKLCNSLNTAVRTVSRSSHSPVGTLCLEGPGNTVATDCMLWTLPCFRRPKLGLTCVLRTYCSTCIHVTCYCGSSLLFWFQPTGPIKIITRHNLNCHLFGRLSLAWLKTSIHQLPLKETTTAAHLQICASINQKWQQRPGSTGAGMAERGPSSCTCFPNDPPGAVCAALFEISFKVGPLQLPW